jgi:hypothetical protein
MRVGFGVRIAEKLSRPKMKGTDKNDLRVIVEEVASGCSSESQREANRDPSRRLVASPFEAMGIDEGFGKAYGMTVGIRPIKGESCEIYGED